MDAAQNPYQPPAAKLVDETVPETELAGRAQRFWATFVDGLIAMAWSIPLMFLLGFFEYVKRGQKPPYSLTLTTAAIGFALFVLVQGYFLRASGQTIGKKLLGLRIVGADGKVPDVVRIIGLRYLPTRLIGLIPILGGIYVLVDILFIFRDDRRCLHDLIAGTRVVKVR